MGKYERKEGIDGMDGREKARKKYWNEVSKKKGYEGRGVGKKEGKMEGKIDKKGRKYGKREGKKKKGMNEE